MTIKLLILKSGEEMISDISEMAVGEEDEQKIIGYFLRRPCLISTPQLTPRRTLGDVAL